MYMIHNIFFVLHVNKSYKSTDAPFAWASNNNNNNNKYLLCGTTAFKELSTPSN